MYQSWVHEVEELLDIGSALYRVQLIAHLRDCVQANEDILSSDNMLISIIILFKSDNEVHNHMHTHTHTNTQNTETLYPKILQTWVTMLLVLFNQVCKKIALQLCKTILKRGLNKIWVTLLCCLKPKKVLRHLLQHAASLLMVPEL